jgi:hypothetical protein
MPLLSNTPSKFSLFASRVYPLLRMTVSHNSWISQYWHTWRNFPANISSLTRSTNPSRKRDRAGWHRRNREYSWIDVHTITRLVREVGYWKERWSYEKTGFSLFLDLSCILIWFLKSLSRRCGSLNWSWPWFLWKLPYLQDSTLAFGDLYVEHVSPHDQKCTYAISADQTVGASVTYDIVEPRHFLVGPFPASIVVRIVDALNLNYRKLYLMSGKVSHSSRVTFLKW